MAPTDSASSPSSVSVLRRIVYHSFSLIGWTSSTGVKGWRASWSVGRAVEVPNRRRWVPKASIAGETRCQLYDHLHARIQRDSSSRLESALENRPRLPERPVKPEQGQRGQDYSRTYGTCAGRAEAPWHPAPIHPHRTSTPQAGAP